MSQVAWRAWGEWDVRPAREREAVAQPGRRNIACGPRFGAVVAAVTERLATLTPVRHAVVKAHRLTRSGCRE